MTTLQIHRVTKIIVKVSDEYPPTPEGAKGFFSREISICHTDPHGNEQEVTIQVFSSDNLEVIS
jgi:hypothetical protein